MKHFIYLSFFSFFGCASNNNFDIPPISATTLANNSISCLMEDFESYDANFNKFSNYINHVSKGSSTWTVQRFIVSSYIEASAYGSNRTNISQFLIPIDFSKADAISFKTKDGYNNGNPLKIYYTNSFQISNYRNNLFLPTKDTSLFTDITNLFKISTGNTTNYAKTFTDSGTVNFSTLNASGTGFIVFEYDNSPTNKEYVTTTIQIDDIKITDNENLGCLSVK